LSLLDDAVAEDPVSRAGAWLRCRAGGGRLRPVGLRLCAHLCDADRTSPPERNQALFAGIDGVTISGGRRRTGAAFRLCRAARLHLAAAAKRCRQRARGCSLWRKLGAHSVDLWMADDGLLVHAVSIAPASRLGELIGQVCAGGE
jgi:hypothetical protein